MVQVHPNPQCPAACQPFHPSLVAWVGADADHVAKRHFGGVVGFASGGRDDRAGGVKHRSACRLKGTVGPASRRSQVRSCPREASVSRICVPRAAGLSRVGGRRGRMMRKAPQWCRAGSTAVGASPPRRRVPAWIIGLQAMGGGRPPRRVRVTGMKPRGMPTTTLSGRCSCVQDDRTSPSPSVASSCAASQFLRFCPVSLLVKVWTIACPKGPVAIPGMRPGW